MYKANRPLRRKRTVFQIILMGYRVLTFGLEAVYFAKVFSISKEGRISFMLRML